MKLIGFLASSSNRFSFKKVLTRKIVTTVSLSLLMALGTLTFTSPEGKRLLSVTLPEPVETAETTTAYEPQPKGLSRERADFKKAVDILAEAAEANPRLSGYYKRVVKRLGGEAVKSESGSGIRAIKRFNPPSREKTAVADTPAAYRNEPEALKGYMAEGMVADANEAASPEPVESVVTEPLSSSESLALTVGDMVFETNPAVEKWVSHYSVSTGGRRTLEVGIERSNQYLEMAREEFRRTGVPEDLVWLALVESVWNPRAVSPAAAGGIWQFIPKTAKEYGLKVESGNDERGDPVKQTRVAAAYLRDLYTIFGDWALAMAAYNCGEPRVMKAIVENGRANYWEICEKRLLPEETRNYVPKILAAIRVVGRAGTKGLTASQN